ncbi:tRNA preQ1(34) S-adenosylmethionine ribosyltransferase-isomerase QueA [candidate division WOR-3 bacterium]|uniref:S-adenosylmethionine:tRNA ribosyltransferase-isomerase n=1 Tax=candidate division WOR-3 bacterium TaxID=2052148 RepID=A0A9D5KAY0_UNCW3|nr:tRNA preQ1(34) S-adenosylmethionine ribosyltransferase-isomerase QueA [candidate division WOR-3 bacterium]MBD3365394.1 tRNA preQ1(34) S-adenosylmethionine ribosyltransferase-isomerase QueA [candidate division WOR-3 bacterium]
MRVEEFRYDLPEDRIALYPAQPRDACLLIVVHRDSGRIEHSRFRDIIDYLKPGDCIVLNESKVQPVRFRLRRISGGLIELLFTGKDDGQWIALVRPAKRIKTKEKLIDERGEEVVEILEIDKGKVRLKLLIEEESLFESLGLAPLPAYIKRVPEEIDLKTYQAVFARKGFSIAAPTAGLHFTKKLLETIRTKGVQVVYIRLDVGEGTFRPIKTDKVEDHSMLPENFLITDKAARIINNAKRIIAVGTTVTRTLESFPEENGIMPGRRSTDLFIYPGYKFRYVDTLLTNFHQPSSTPLLLTCAFAGKEMILEAYRQALGKGYRFLSYGDAMLIL